jgi:hypothetical protein
MHDITEPVRRIQVAAINSSVESDDKASEKARLEDIHGKGNVWSTDELSTRFEVIGFMAPYCVVKDRQTGKKGSVQFQHSPRFYFNYVED